MTVFVTNTSRARATSGASSASRQPDALKIMRPPGPARPRRAAAARRRSPRSIRSRRRTRTPSAPPRRAVRRGRARGPPPASARAHRRGRRDLPGRSSVTRVGSTTTCALGTSAAASACQSLRKPRIAGGPPSCCERYGNGATPMPPPTRSGRSDVQPKAVSEWPEDVDLLARLDRCEGSRARPDRLEQERELARRRLAKAHRAWKEPAGRLEHEELARARRGRCRRAPLGRAHRGRPPRWRRL